MATTHRNSTQLRMLRSQKRERRCVHFQTHHNCSSSPCTFIELPCRPTGRSVCQMNLTFVMTSCRYVAPRDPTLGISPIPLIWPYLYCHHHFPAWCIWNYIFEITTSACPQPFTRSKCLCRCFCRHCLPILRPLRPSDTSSRTSILQLVSMGSMNHPKHHKPAHVLILSIY